jgi:hypothetical protein
MTGEAAEVCPHIREVVLLFWSSAARWSVKGWRRRAREYRRVLRTRGL